MVHVAEHQPFNEAEFAKLKRVIEEGVKKQLSVALEKRRVSQSFYFFA